MIVKINFYQILVDINLTLTNNSNIIIPLDLPNIPSFEIRENGQLIIDNGGLTLDTHTNEDYKNLLDNIKLNVSYEIDIVKGPYSGRFNDITIQYSKDVSSCEALVPKMKEKDTLLTVSFSIDDSSCIKWWVILLICEGIVVFLMVVALILIMTVRPIKSWVLPYRST